MLTRLCLRDYVLAERVEVEFAPGFCVLTGETGAGKSLLVGALSLLSGARAGAVRPAAAQAEIEAVFSVADNADALAWLEAAGLREESAEVIVRRVIKAERGKSTAFINGRQTPLTQTAELVGLLTEICGQHAHYSLRRGEAQRALFDQYADAPTADLAATFKQWSRLDKQYRRAESDAAEQSRLAAAVQEELSELEQLSFNDEKWKEMNDILTKMANLSDISDAVSGALRQLDGEQDSARAAIAGATRALQTIEKHDRAVGEWRTVLEDAGALVDEVARALNGYGERLQPDDAAYAAAEEFIAACHHLARKYGAPDPARLGALIEEKRRKLAAFSTAADLSRLRAARDAAGQDLDENLTAVTKARTAGAKTFSAQVNALLKQLGMAKARFSVSLESLPTATAHGRENVAFQLATRAGRAPGGIADIASGGELSRLGLAVQMAAGRAEGKGVLVFDEVDAGVGGATADVVGRLLSSLGKNGQVLCVTHLPQVAAYADHHWRVGGADMEVAYLDRAGRVEELARMQSGREVTDTGRRHAQEMLALAGQS